MQETTQQGVIRHAVPMFVAAVTVFLLAFAFVQAGRGLAGLAGAVVYAFAAGFGLEFVGAAWTGRLRGACSDRPLQG